MNRGTQTWLGFGAMCLGMFIAILDIQVVASSLTEIGRALFIPDYRLSWIQTGYLTAEIVSIPLTGILTSALTLRWMFAAATLGFTVLSALCAMSTGADCLISLRVAQGFFGGMLIPAVFTSAFILIDEKHRALATTLAGVCAMVAPAVGPIVGGYIAETYSWRWIFLINVPLGFCIVAAVIGFVRHGSPDVAVLRRIDLGTMLLVALFLATLEIALTEGPRHDWRGTYIVSLVLICASSGTLAVRRALTHSSPFINIRRFANRDFSVGCALSFVLGFGLYGSIYLLSIFLGLVRGHSPLEIGEIMLVTGIARLLVAPLATILELRVDARLLTAIGFGLFGIGVLANAFCQSTVDSDDVFFWQQAIRGAALMLCLLPAARLALDGWNKDDVADASGIFNLIRNVGGAIGISVTDTIIEERTPGHIATLALRLQAGNPDAARIVGLPVERFHNHDMGPVNAATREMIAPMVQHAGLTQSINECWLAMGLLFVASLFLLPIVGRGAKSSN